jgi:uncharacterized Rmd1/YagE family protein
MPPALHASIDTDTVTDLRQVLQDMLQLLKESVSSRHSELLEQIVIALIVVEIGTFIPFRAFPVAGF